MQNFETVSVTMKTILTDTGFNERLATMNNTKKNRQTIPGDTEKIRQAIKDVVAMVQFSHGSTKNHESDHFFQNEDNRDNRDKQESRNNLMNKRIRSWIQYLDKSGWLQIEEIKPLIDYDPVLATLFFNSLKLSVQHDLHELWKNNSASLDEALTINPTLGKDIISRMALAIDLETDGRKIWEIGIAHHDNSIRLHDTTQNTDLQNALKTLLTEINNARIIVGHNILAWDWPILSDMVPDLPGSLIWDTLLIQFLLDPKAKSHALGSNHHAETDAKAAFNLFINQIDTLGPTLKSKILLGHVRFSAALISAIASAIPENLTYARPAPIFLDRARPGIPILFPSRIIHEIDWVPSVQITQANPDESLNPAYWQIDTERLQDILSPDLKRTSNALVLLTMCDHAKQQGIPIRHNMIPEWVHDGFPKLAIAINQSCIIPTDTEVVRVAPLPISLSWWTNAATMHYRAVLPGKGPLVINRYNLNNEKTLQFGTAINTALVRIPGHDGSRWALPDPAARVLDINGGWRGFDVVSIPESFEIIEQQPNLPNIKPILVMRKFSVLFPGTRAQGDYWISQIASLRAVRKDGVVPVFLLTGTTSRIMVDLLNTACAEVGMGEIKPEHRSRREHLQRALPRNGTIIDIIDNWHDWQAIADDSGITLQPVIEALPLEEWHALSVNINQDINQDLAQVTDQGQAIDQNQTVEQIPIKIPMVEILKDVQKLVESRLDSWLVETGLVKHTLPPIILDPRLETAAYDLRARIIRKPITLQDWSINQHKKLRNVFSDFEMKREEAPSDFAAMERFLVKNWQPRDPSNENTVKGFKSTQAEAMKHICTRNEDVMVTLPTGEGKSVLFQVPALCRGLRNRRLTLVISPLKALMLDQVMRLREQGFEESADFINNDRTHLEQNDVMQGVLDNRIILLYIAPERLRNPRFVDVLQRRIQSDGGLEHVVFDEAHCINQWGYEFRPDYFYAFSFLVNTLRDGTLHDYTPFLLMSATLTGSDRRGIQEFLKRTVQEEAILPLAICPDPAIQSSPLRTHIKVLPHTMRSNIFDHKIFSNAIEERFPEICNIIRKAGDNTKTTGQRSAVIIFVSRRIHADELAEKLTSETQCDVESYHAGLDAPTREDIYNRFRDGELNFLVATKAFGMGMDIPDIHWVIHLAPPVYLEDYLQEVGRIGRGVKERQKAELDKLDAILMSSPSDFENIRSQRAQNEIQKPQIDTIEEKILAVSEIVEGQKIAIVPDYGYENYKSAGERRANATRLRLALYWLEKAGHLTQLGMINDILKVTTVSSRLAKIAGLDSIQGRVARAILDATVENGPTNEVETTNEADTTNETDTTNEDNEVTEDHLTTENERPKSLIGGFLHRILNAVGIRIKSNDSNNTGNISTSSSDTNNDTTDTRITNGNNTDVSQDTQDMLINLSQIRRQCEIENLDKTMSLVVELAELGAIELKWELEFAKRPLLDEGLVRSNILITMVGKAVHRLLRDLNKTGEVQFDPHEWFNPEPLKLINPEEKELSPEREQISPDIQLKRYERAFINGFRTLARVCGIRMKQIVQSGSDTIHWHARLPTAKNRIAGNKCNRQVSRQMCEVYSDRPGNIIGRGFYQGG